MVVVVVCLQVCAFSPNEQVCCSYKYSLTQIYRELKCEKKQKNTIVQSNLNISYQSTAPLIVEPYFYSQPKNIRIIFEFSPLSLTKFCWFHICSILLLLFYLLSVFSLSFFFPLVCCNAAELVYLLQPLCLDLTLGYRINIFCSPGKERHSTPSRLSFLTYLFNLFFSTLFFYNWPLQPNKRPIAPFGNSWISRSIPFHFLLHKPPSF